MTCQELYDFLEQFVEGEMADDVRAEFQRHLDMCPPCIDYVDSYRKTIQCCKAAYDDPKECPDQPMPKQLVQAILDTVRKAD